MEKRFDEQLDSMTDFEFREFLATISKPKYNFSYEEVAETAIESLGNIDDEIIDGLLNDLKRQDRSRIMNARLATSIVMMPEVQMIKDNAHEKRERRDYPSFILWEDVSLGAMTVVTYLIQSDLHFRGEKRVQEMFTKMLSDANDMVEEAKYRGVEGARLITEDLTGHKLVDEVVKKIEGNSSLIEGQDLVGTRIKEFVVVGARHAKKLYETVYPVATEKFGHRA